MSGWWRRVRRRLGRLLGGRDPVAAACWRWARDPESTISELHEELDRLLRPAPRERFNRWLDFFMVP